MGYLANFMVYTLAMVGVIVLALFVFKNSTGIQRTKGSKYLKIVDALSIGQRKTLYIVSTGNEKFLIASDVDKTNLISKLECKNTIDVLPKEYSESTVENTKGEPSKNNSFRQTLENVAKPSFMDKSNIGIKSSILDQKPVMRALAERIKR